MTEMRLQRSHFRRLALPSALLFLSVSAVGFAHPAVDCEERADEIARLTSVEGAEAVRERWSQHVRFVREARPGTAYYAPRPFPTSPEAIEENFRYAYFEKLFDGGPESLEPSERPIYEGLLDGTVDLRIERVENWQLTRCSARREVPYFHLIRLFDPNDRELARASIHPTGLLGRYAQVTSIGSRALPDLDRVAERVHAMSGRALKPKQAQYASIDGLPLHCGPLVPCVVFEADGSQWVLDRSALLFEIRPQARRVSVTGYRAESRDAGLRPLGPRIEEATMITRGFEWVEARLVARDEEMAKMQGVPATKTPE